MSATTKPMLFDSNGKVIEQWYDATNDVFRAVSDRYPFPVSQALKTGTVSGAKITTSGSSSYVAIPLTSQGELPNRCRLAATAACYVKVGHGGDATATASLKAVTISAIAAAGSGYAAGDTIDLAGGTSTVATQLTIDTTKLISTSLNVAGSGYNVADVITLAGGTNSVAGTLTVSTVKLVSTSLNATGSGYAANDTVTLVGGTNSIAAEITIDTVDGGGAILTYHISNAGSYTVKAAALTQGSTSGTGTGATFQTSLYGVRTFTVSDAGSYTVNSTTFTQASVTPAGGTGATFNSALYGVKTASITTGGKYSVIPSNDVAQDISSGSGTNAQFTMIWGVGTIDVTVAGLGYATPPAVSLSGGSGSGASATAVLAPDGSITSIIAVAGTGYASVPSVSIATDITAAIGDMLVQPGDAVVVETTNFAHVAAIQVTTGGILQISPIEN